MAIRFIDTGFFKSPYVRTLQAPLKLLYSLIICEASAAGIYIKDLEIASLYIGLKVTDADFDYFIKTGKAVEIGQDKYFFPDFIEHQYPKGLQSNNPAHRNIINELKKYNLIDENNNIITRGIEAPLKPLSRCLSNSNGNSNSNSNSKEEVSNYNAMHDKTEKKQETKFDAKDALLKMGVDSNLADEWLKVRKNKHLTNTRTAFLKIWREIKKTDLTANDCIKAAIEHSWGGFQADWLTNSTFAKKGHKNDESSLTNPEVYKNIKFT
jgi:hypothetical protein